MTRAVQILLREQARVIEMAKFWASDYKARKALGD